MKNLEQRQREMRERNLAPNCSNDTVVVPIRSKQAERPPDPIALKKKIAELEKQVHALEVENQRLRALKSIVVEPAGRQSYEDKVREQRHNFFKYSNARRY